MAGQEELRDAVAKAKLENPGLGVKKLVALVKNSSPELAKVGAKEVRQVLAELASSLETATPKPKQSVEPEIEPQPAPEASAVAEEVKENVDSAAGVAVAGVIGFVGLIIPNCHHALAPLSRRAARTATPRAPLARPRASGSLSSCWTCAT